MAHSIGGVPRAAHRIRPATWTLLGICGLTAIALALRIVGIDQSLYGDEDFTYYIVIRDGVSDVWDDVYDTSITPPLHYLLAWASLKLEGDPTVLVRLPSLVLGTALVPLVFFLGRRVAGARAGLLAATLIALGPFAIWYSDEARAYATMMFLVALSTLALLRALQDGRWPWWLLYVVCSCGALWTHYTAVFVIVAQACWALWARRNRWRALILAQAAVVAGFLPWLPGFLQQRRNEEGLGILDVFGEASVGAVIKLPVRTLVGHPEVGLRDFPGATGLLLFALLAAGAIAIAVAATANRRTPVLGQLTTLIRSETGLVLILAVATPLGLLAYAALGSSLFLPRNLAASQPALAVSAALLIDRILALLPWRLAALAAAGLVAVLALNALESLGESRRRPPYREAAQYVERVADDADPLVEVPLPLPRDERLPPTTLERYLDDGLRVYQADAGDAWRQLGAGRSLYQVRPRLLRPSEFVKLQLAPGESAPPDLLGRLDRIGGPDGRGLGSSTKLFPGLIPIEVARYRGRVAGRLTERDGRETIAWSLGAPVVVSPGVADGSVETVALAGGSAFVTGWALDAARRRPVDWVLLFSGNRLLAVSAGGVRRPDIAAEKGASTPLIGFALATSSAPRDPSRMRVFAVVGDRASELPVDTTGGA